MSFSMNPPSRATEATQPISRVVLKSDIPRAYNPESADLGNVVAHIESVVTGLGVTVIEEPEIIPFRMRSPPLTPSRSAEPHPIVIGEESETDRGRVQAAKAAPSLSAKAAKRRRKKQNQQNSALAAHAMNTVRGFTPSESGAEDSDAGTSSPKDRKSTRLNSSHTVISYAVFCLKKKKKEDTQ